MGHLMCQPKKPPTGEKCDRFLKGMRSPIILILGKPRTGKEAIIRSMMIRYKIRHVNFNKLVLEEVKMGSTLGHIMEDCIMAQGTLVPRIVALEILKQYMCKMMYESSGFILEGYPRNIQQVLDFEEYIAPISMVIYLCLPPYWAHKRIMVELPARGYPDVYGDVIAWRNAIFDERTEFILDYYEDKLLFLNGLRPTMYVYVEVMDAIDELFLKLGIESPSRFN